jgi:uroporphyrinogen-III decarboxylase
MPRETEKKTGVVPCRVGINYTIWEQYSERLEKLKAEAPHVHIGGWQGKDSPRAREYKWRDEWGCLWHFPGMGLDGQVIEHPLESWDALETWQPPSPEARIRAIREQAEKRKAAEQPPPDGGLEHGFLFLRLTYLRGFENFMLDVGDDDPRIYELRDVVTDYWYKVAEAALDAGARRIVGGDDLGLQDRLPLSPDAWRRLLKPGFRKIIGLARERGAEFYFHTDGYIVDIIPDLIECGVTTLNPQDLVNGLDTLARLAKGKITISLDIDRQSVTVFGTPEEIDAHLRKCIETLGSPEGGLELIWGVYPGTPIENIEACVRAMEKYHDLWVW